MPTGAPMSLFTDAKKAAESRRTETSGRAAVQRVLAGHGYTKLPKIETGRDPELGTIRISIWQDTPDGDIVLVSGPRIVNEVHRKGDLAQTPNARRGGFAVQTAPGTLPRAQRAAVQRAKTRAASTTLSAPRKAKIRSSTRTTRRKKRAAAVDIIDVVVPRLNKMDSWHRYVEQFPGGDAYDPSYAPEPDKAHVMETKKLSPSAYDTFVTSFLRGRDWLAGKGGIYTTTDPYPHDDTKTWTDLTPAEQDEWKRGSYRQVVEVTAPERMPVYVDPSGYNYARYVAFPAGTTSEWTPTGQTQASAPATGETVKVRVSPGVQGEWHALEVDTLDRTDGDDRKVAFVDQFTAQRGPVYTFTGAAVDYLLEPLGAIGNTVDILNDKADHGDAGARSMARALVRIGREVRKQSPDAAARIGKEVRARREREAKATRACGSVAPSKARSSAAGPATVTLTDHQKDFLRAVVTSQYQDGNVGPETIGHDVWLWDALGGVSAKASAHGGIVAQAQDKGLITVVTDPDPDESTVAITPLGWASLEAAADTPKGAMSEDDELKVFEQMMASVEGVIKAGGGESDLKAALNLD